MAKIPSNSAAPFVPETHTLHALREAVQQCRGCDLYRDATQAVFGELEKAMDEGKPKVAIMMIGEQPGDQEDKQGRPFVGPRENCWIDVWNRPGLIGKKSMPRIQ